MPITNNQWGGGIGVWMCEWETILKRFIYGVSLSNNAASAGPQRHLCKWSRRCFADTVHWPSRNTVKFSKWISRHDTASVPTVWQLTLLIGLSPSASGFNKRHNQSSSSSSIHTANIYIQISVSLSESSHVNYVCNYLMLSSNSNFCHLLMRNSFQCHQFILLGLNVALVKTCAN